MKHDRHETGSSAPFICRKAVHAHHAVSCNCAVPLKIWDSYVFSIMTAGGTPASFKTCLKILFPAVHRRKLLVGDAQDFRRIFNKH
jgi:hypothetical protein